MLSTMTINIAALNKMTFNMLKLAVLNIMKLSIIAQMPLNIAPFNIIALALKVQHYEITITQFSAGFSTKS